MLRRLPEGKANAKKRKKVLVNLSLMTPRKLDGLEEVKKRKKKKRRKNDRVLILEGGDDEVDDDAETVVEGDKEVLYLSDAHVEMMLIHALGPRTEFIATGILRSVKMSKEPPLRGSVLRLIMCATGRTLYVGATASCHVKRF